MLLTLTTTHHPATDLGFLLEKHPERAQRFDLPWGSAHVVYPEADEARCTMALVLDIDPLRLTKVARRRGETGTLAQYVNDRPYVASSLLSVALAQVFSSALRGKSRQRPDLAARAIPLEAHFPTLPCRGGERALRELFEPLGYEVEAHARPLDPRFPEWGESPSFAVTLRARTPLSALLTHLYVLVPVLDDEKHYFVGMDEVEKLIARGEGWLAAHPARERIVERYLRRYRHLTRAALAQLGEGADLDAEREAHDADEARLERRISLDERRREAVIAALREHGARRVLDLGCGEGKLVRELASEPGFEVVAGADVSARALERARDRLENVRRHVTLFVASALYRDARFSGYDAISLVEVIEHVDPPRLETLARVVFEQAAPPLVLVTTPNREHNARFESLAAGAMRHRDHRFEWSRAELAAWANDVCARYGYRVSFIPIGEDDPELGPPTQMALFERGGGS